jgi:hypothetical protein
MYIHKKMCQLQVITLFTLNKTNENVETESIGVIIFWIRTVMLNGRNNHELQMSELGACKISVFHLPCSKRGAAFHTTFALLLNRLMWISCELCEHIGRPTLMKPKVRTNMIETANAVVS